MLFPGGSRPAAKEYSSVPSMCWQRQPWIVPPWALGTQAYAGLCLALSLASGPVLQSSTLGTQYPNILFSLDHALLGLGEV